MLAPGTGGAVARFTVAGHDVLRPAPESAVAFGDVRAMASYPLVPWSNRIAHASLAWDGRTHGLARNFGDHPHSLHGAGWQRPWHIERHGKAAATLAFVHDPADAGADAWPFAFSARQYFALGGRDGATVLTMTLAIASRDARPFPFGLGWHPFFPRTPDTTLAFAARGVWRNDATQLPVEHVAIPAAWDHATPRAPAPLDNVFTGWSGRATLRGAARAPVVTLTADSACGHLVVYAPEGRDYVAVEPVTQMTDAFNRAARGARDTGTRVLAPGAAFSCTMQLVVTRA